MMLPLPLSCLARKSAAILPPAMLSEAMCEATSAPSTPRSSVITGMFARCADCTAPARAEESVGLSRMTETRFWIRSSTLEIWRAGSSCASTTTSCKPASLAAFWAPSLSSTKNGLFCVDRARPITGVPEAAAPPAVEAAAGVDSPGPCCEQAASSVAAAAARNVTLRMAYFPRFVFLLPPVEQDGDQDDDALHHLLVERAYAEQIETIIQ